MLITITFNRMVQTITVVSYILCLGTSFVYAAPMTSRLDDFHPNCDIRPLNLSRKQRSELSAIRKEYKKALEKSMRRDDRINKNRRRDIIHILSDDRFNKEDARDYVEKRYLTSMDFAVDELSIQHRFYKMLTPQQRQYWLSACLK
ncbi:Spy/CpxP family protein refolding chaperone [Neisseria montereyensis]|uniref:Periplasmic protein n=1 Tax=Neisseria montereyensis TaxID=2973938 RepID=A0ABT2FAG1_9NEIS|nr:hypothetical protein [Neisseria montereyensis]MCS4533095.1 hypothetical protein [Neisseria montereyensis]